MKKITYLYALAGVAALNFRLPVAQAGEVIQPIQPADGINNGTAALNWTSIKDFAGSIITVLLFIAGFLAVAYLIYNGIQYITSAGNPDKVKAARAGIINAVIGIAVIAAAYLIINFAIGLGKGVGDVINDPGSIK